MVSVSQLIKAVIPHDVLIKVKRLSSDLDKALLSFLSRSRLGSNLYYAFFSQSFAREHQSVLVGRVKYSQLINENLSSSYLIRRNIHRLEKGLIMKPRKDVFATDYIQETVDAYVQAATAKEQDLTDGELQWAHDVLNKYFTVTASEAKIDQARAKFFSLKPIDAEHKYIPYKRDLKQTATSYEDFLQLCWQRRSVRWYLPKKVPRELIDQAITAATLAPSACNRQPFQFRIFDQGEMVQKVASIAQGTKGFNHNFPTIVVVVGQLSAYFNERDRHIIYIDASLASMSLMFALETLGLSSCPINWPEIESWDVKITNLIELEPDERVIMLISIGYPDPDGMVPYSQKKSLDIIRRYG